MNEGINVMECPLIELKLRVEFHYVTISSVSLKRIRRHSKVNCGDLLF